MAIPCAQHNPVRQCGQELSIEQKSSDSALAGQIQGGYKGMVSQVS